MAKWSLCSEVHTSEKSLKCHYICLIHVFFNLFNVYIMVLKLISYNSRGFGPGKPEYIRKLCKSHDILLIQEHWLLESQINNLQRLIPECNFMGISGIEEGELLQGRPYGGCAILWNKNLKCKVEPLQSTSKRVCGVKLLTNNTMIVIINVYMPCDNVDSKLFSETLNEIEYLTCCAKCDNVMICGDFNTDFSRVRSKNTNSLSEFVKDQRLFPCINHVLSKVAYTYENSFTKSKSLIDHFIITENLRGHIMKYHCLDEGDNLSDHIPVVCHIDVPVSLQSSINVNFNVKSMWQKVTLEQVADYQHFLDIELNGIVIPTDITSCQNVLCECHNNDIERLYNSVCDACLKASNSCFLGNKSGTRKTPIPGWNDQVQGHRDQAIFWHQIWKSCGSPSTGWVANIRRSTRAKYHLAIRKVKQNKDSISAQNLAYNMLQNNTKDFWEEISRLEGKSCNNVYPSQLDNTYGDKNISDLLAGKYSNLYQSVSYDEQEMILFKNEITERINKSSDESDVNITADEVEQALKSIKYNKREGCTEIMSDHIKYGTRKLFIYIAILLTCMVKHGFSPTNFGACTIKPIPKSMRKSLYDSDNYRSIALGSILCKVLDHIIIKKFPNVLSSSNMQFGFKSQHSTNMCTFVLNEVVHYYDNKNTPVNGIFLDASKAFDKVQYIKLFWLLLEKGMCPVIIRFLLNSYTSQIMFVKWKNEISESFNIRNGVKQGGVLSPILFSIYFDELLYRLKKSEVGCYIGDQFLGALAYADDVVLLAPTTTAANIMLTEAVKFAAEYNVSFNASKTKHVLFNDYDSVANVTIGSTIISSIQTELHLGNTVGKTYNSENISNCIRNFNSKVNKLVATFSNCDFKVKYKLFKTYCMPLYGSQLWDLSSNEMDKFYVTWRKAIRRVLNVPYTTHCALLPLICEDSPIDRQIENRILKFLNNIYKCATNNTCVKIAFKIMLEGSKSSISNSVTTLCDKYQICRYNLNYVKTFNSNCTNTESECIGVAIRELINIRDGIQEAADLTRDEASHWLNILCIS